MKVRFDPEDAGYLCVTQEELKQNDLQRKLSSYGQLADLYRQIVGLSADAPPDSGLSGDMMIEPTFDT